MDVDLQSTAAGNVLDLKASRRLFVQAAAAATAATSLPMAVAAPLPSRQPLGAGSDSGSVLQPATLRVNGIAHALTIDPRVTLLDALREHLHLTGTKKGCDHGQCGACTVLVDGRRINSCLTLALMAEGAEITTIEGLGSERDLHPLQTAFIRHDGFQCGYCTPGQICSAVAMLSEARAGAVSSVTLAGPRPPSLDDAEIRERMSGNLCRCGAYPNIVAAIRDVAASSS